MLVADICIFFALYMYRTYWKRKMRILGLVSICFVVLFIFFKLCYVNLSHDKKNSWKYDYDNNQELQPVGLLKNGVLQVLSSWENQTVLQCLKHHRKNCFTFNIFWELKMESFGEAASKETCFSLYLEKGKLFIQLFWLLSFTMVAKKNTFSLEFLLPWKKTWKKVMW